jgi:peptidoglycan/LPS O-acetylase OafA/YrhL
VNTVFIQNYLPEDCRWPHSWSLAVEEHFYLLLPLLLMVVATWYARRRRCTGAASTDPFRAIPIAGAGIALVALALRALSATLIDDWRQTYYPTHCRVDSLMFGVVLGYLYMYRRESLRVVEKWRLPLICLTVLIALLPLLVRRESSIPMQIAGYTWLFLGSGVLVALAAQSPSYGTAGSRWFVTGAGCLRWLGIYSYTLYLSHSVVFALPGRQWLVDQFRLHVWDSLWVERLLFWAMSLTGAVLLSHLVERPLLRRRDKWFPAQPGTVVMTTDRQPDCVSLIHA